MAEPSGRRFEDDSDEKQLLTPTSAISGGYIFMRSENDLATASDQSSEAPVDSIYPNVALIYSEPAHLNISNVLAPAAELPEIVVDDALEDGAISSVDNVPSAITSRHNVNFAPGTTPQNSVNLDDDSKNNSGAIATGVVAPSERCRRPAQHQQSFSTREIREQHAQVQQKYRPKGRRRHYTDPVDFEGILNIIGGCSWWQIWIYLLISLQQVPHAMFNLSVVYMMYQPDHWCKIDGFSRYGPKGFESDHSVLYKEGMTWDQVLNNTYIAFPHVINHQREDQLFHDQCHYYVRNESRYHEFLHMTPAELLNVTRDEEVGEIRACTEWEFEQEVMVETIATEWNLVCDSSMKRAHAHLFYSLGYLLGCLIGGFASDRFGRKPTVIGFGVLSSLFGLILPYSTYFPMFLFIRFLGAMCNEAADLAAYVLCMEITGTKYRAMVGSLLQAPWAIGYALLALVAYLTKSWRTMQLITAGLHSGAVMLICLLPESPRWLIVNNRVREAERYIRKACRMNNSSLPSDLELVKHAEQRKWVKRNQRANMLHLLKSKALLFRTLVIFIVWIATALVYYGLVISVSDQSSPGRSLFSGNFFVNNAIAGFIELPTLLGCVFLMKFGRKRSQMFCLICSGLSICVGIAIMASKSSHVLALVFMMLGKVFIQGGFNILYIFTSELYPTVIRNTAVGVCSMIARIGSGASSYIALLSDYTLTSAPMIVFAIFSLFAGTLVMLLPETRDQPLPDTLQDAVTFLRNDMTSRYHCAGGGDKDGQNSISVDTNQANAGATARQSSADSPRKSIMVTKNGSLVKPLRQASNPSDCYQRQDSIFEDLASLKIPDTLPEAFGDD